jgi:hypothetical protein
LPEKQANRIQPKEGDRHQHDSAKTALADEPARLFKLNLLDVINDLFRKAPKEFKDLGPGPRYMFNAMEALHRYVEG